MLGWKTVTIAHEIECYFFLSFFKKICKVQSSVFMHIVYTCICFPEQLNNNKYDVNGDCGIFVGGACLHYFSPSPPLLPCVSHSVVSHSFFVCDPMDCSLPGSSFQAWNSPGKNTGMGCCSFLQGNFLTQGSNPGFLHRRQILYPLSHQGSLTTMVQEYYKGFWWILRVYISHWGWNSVELRQ